MSGDLYANVGKEEREEVALATYARFPYRQEKAYGIPVVYTLEQVFFHNGKEVRTEELQSDANIHGIMHILGEYLEERADFDGVTEETWTFRVKMTPVEGES